MTDAPVTAAERKPARRKTGETARAETSRGLVPFERMREEMLEMAETLWRGAPSAAFGWAGAPAFRWAEPAIDMSEDDDAYVLTAEMPGVKKSDVSVTLENGLLVITGEKHDHHEENRKHHQYAERRFGSVRRALAVPRDADPARIDAHYADGVLTVRIAKREGAQDAARIPVK